MSVGSFSGLRLGRDRSCALTTTPDGVNAHAFDRMPQRTKLVVRNGSVPRVAGVRQPRGMRARRGGRRRRDLRACSSRTPATLRARRGGHRAGGHPSRTLSSDNRVVTEEWTDALECPRDAETNADARMFTFYDAAGTRRRT